MEGPQKDRDRCEEGTGSAARRRRDGLQPPRVRGRARQDGVGATASSRHGFGDGLGRTGFGLGSTALGALGQSLNEGAWVSLPMNSATIS